MNNNVLYHALIVTCYPYVKFEGVANYTFCLLAKVRVAKVKGCGRCLQLFWVQRLDEHAEEVKRIEGEVTYLVFGDCSCSGSRSLR